jgi:hypothetical protein
VCVAGSHWNCSGLKVSCTVIIANMKVKLSSLRTCTSVFRLKVKMYMAGCGCIFVPFDSVHYSCNWTMN